MVGFPKKPTDPELQGTFVVFQLFPWFPSIIWVAPHPKLAIDYRSLIPDSEKEALPGPSPIP